MSNWTRSGYLDRLAQKEQQLLTPDHSAPPTGSRKISLQALLSPSIQQRHRRISSHAQTHNQHHTRVSQTTFGRRRRDTRHAMTSTAPSAITTTTNDMQVLEENKKGESGGYLDRSLPKIELFRRMSKLIQLFTTLCLLSHKSEKARTELTKQTVFTEYLKGEEEENETRKSELYFDFSYFKANRKMYVSMETKHILMLTPNTRSEQQITKVKYWLSNIRTFAEYPRRMQHKLVQVGWYEGHPAKKVLIRQGHRPQAFYFLLSGSAVVTVMDKHTQISQTVHFLKRGDSFGELAILHDTVRQSTIITREFCELLVISKEDFVDIFMASGGVKNITDPDHSDFIKSIHFLKDWPIEQLVLNPKQCLFHFFRRGAVLVKDSNRSDWIYIIKSGSCRVLKKLRKVGSRLTEHQERVVGFERVSSQIKTSLDHFNKLRLTVSALGAFKPSPVTEENPPETKTPSNCDAIDKVAKAQEERPQNSKLKRRRSTLRDRNATERGEERRTSLVVVKDKKSLSLPPVDTNVNNERNISANSSWLRLRSALKMKKNLGQGRKNSKQNPDESEQLPSNTLSFLDEDNTKKKDNDDQIDDGYVPVFVEVASLTKGDTFGVNFMIFENQPCVSLVSNGAECIVISKKLFLAHCTEAMKRRLLLEEQPYPDDEHFQKTLQDKTNWQTFKTQTLQTTVDNIALYSRRMSNLTRNENQPAWVTDP